MCELFVCLFFILMLTHPTGLLVAAFFKNYIIIFTSKILTD